MPVPEIASFASPLCPPGEGFVHVPAIGLSEAEAAAGAGDDEAGCVVAVVVVVDPGFPELRNAKKATAAIRINAATEMAATKGIFDAFAGPGWAA